MKLTVKDIKAIANYLGQVAMDKAEQGKPEEEMRIFTLIEKLESEIGD